MNTIKKGRILVYRVYDIGEEIDLEKAEIILQEETTARAKFRLKKINQSAVVVSNDPLSVALGNYSYSDQGIEFNPEITAKIWEFGTLSLTFDFHIPTGTTIDQLRELSDKIQNYDILDIYARGKARELTQQIKASMAKINEWEVNEDYILYFIESFEKDYIDASLILQEEDIAALIINEDKDLLSSQIRERIYSSTLQYYKNDMAIIDWNSAFIIEPTGSLDIPDVIEFALNQLLEMRYYDDLLDKKLREIYSAVELREMNIFSSRYTDLALEAGQKYIEIAEIVESVENSLKVIGDLYHSTVFRMASNKFRFSDWQSSIDNKLDNLAELCKLLLDNINSKRSHIMELVIIALISIELIPFIKQLADYFNR
ncbi:MAG: hypothetical protein H7336_13230 [Bacteriovorax sp.]|nr:hypothetical protein [Bacteriovorax sp.]